MLIQQIIYGGLLIAAGVAMLKFNYQLVGFTGRQDWIENVLGSGTTYFAYKLFAIIVIIAGFIYMTGLANGVLGWILSPLQNAFSGFGKG